MARYSSAVHQESHGVSELEHGQAGYARGCRCEVCKKENSAYKREWRAKRLSELLADPGVQHGTPKLYNLGCRCQPCRDAYSEEKRVRWGPGANRRRAEARKKKREASAPSADVR